MKKISFAKIFKKSESDSGSGKKKLLIIILVIIIIAGVGYLGYPFLFPKTPVKSSVSQKTTTTATATRAKTTPKIETKPEVKEKTAFDIEVENRKQGYTSKVFVYKPYEPPSERNPFQKVRTSYFLEETAKKEEEGKEGSVIRFPKPELPPDTKLTGIIDSKDKKVAIIAMNGETFIANLYDILLDRYIVKEIKKDEVIIDINGYFFSLKLGGEEASNG